MFSGWPVGMREMPIMVFTTGMPVPSASSSSSSWASASHTPPPAQMMGCLALPMASTTRLICKSLPFTLGLYPRILTSSGQSKDFKVCS